MVKRTERIWLKKIWQISHMCHISKNVYNEANYIIRQEFVNNQDEEGNRIWIRYNELWKIIKNQSENYHILPSQSAQQTLKLLEKNWKSFFKSIKDWKKNPDKYLGRPKIPGYLPKDGEFIIKFTNQQCKIRNGYLRFPRKMEIKGVKVRKGIDNDMLREVRLVPKGTGYWLEIVYEKEIEQAQNLDETATITIDIGGQNLVAIADNIGGMPIVIKGGIVRSINQYVNKRMAELYSIYDRQKLEHTPKRIWRMINKRMNKIRDFMNKTTRWIVDYCVDNGIGNIIIGHNDNWKQQINLGRRNNQNFVSIPFNMLIEQLIYKGEEVGIKVHLIDESHTSKCSFLDGESVEQHGNYVGRRIRRGLFRSKNGIVINADVNACYNLMRKAQVILIGTPIVCPDGIEDIGVYPFRLAIV